MHDCRVIVYSRSVAKTKRLSFFSARVAGFRSRHVVITLRSTTVTSPELRRTDEYIIELSFSFGGGGTRVPGRSKGPGRGYRGSVTVLSGGKKKAARHGGVGIFITVYTRRARPFSSFGPHSKFIFIPWTILYIMCTLRVFFVLIKFTINIPNIIFFLLSNRLL